MPCVCLGRHNCTPCLNVSVVANIVFSYIIVIRNPSQVVEPVLFFFSLNHCERRLTEGYCKEAIGQYFKGSISYSCQLIVNFSTRKQFHSRLEANTRFSAKWMQLEESCMCDAVVQPCLYSNGSKRHVNTLFIRMHHFTLHVANNVASRSMHNLVTWDVRMFMLDE